MHERVQLRRGGHLVVSGLNPGAEERVVRDERLDDEADDPVDDD